VAVLHINKSNAVDNSKKVVHPWPRPKPTKYATVFLVDSQQNPTI